MFVFIFQLLLLIGLLYIVYLLFYSMLKGAPYAPIHKEHLPTMLKLLKIKPGEKAVDIGAGDGRIVIALARAGADAYGWEINPLLVLWAKWNILRSGMRGKAHVELKNFLKADFSDYDIFTTYLTQFGMKNVEKKLTEQAKPTARIAADFFQLPSWKATKHEDTIYLYEVAKNKKK
jgi:protein-L-isoaspartate O-methyltransferase